MEFTVDTLLRGRVTLLQPTDGLRTSLDPIFLSAFVVPPFGRFLDVGCGTGALSFLLLARDPAATGVGVEIQPALAALADAGRARNDIETRLTIVADDVRAAPLPPASFDLIATNPPFFRVADGNVSPIAARALASHEVALALDEWVAVAARAVRSGGRVAAIFPAERADELLVTFRAWGLSPARTRFVHPRVERPAGRVLVEAVRGASTLKYEPPLVVHDDGGGFTPEVRWLLGEP
ncbi:MAG TPA: methyltransferase [Polyangia bacterium]|nr:methyltransferase [Polyangia bacterium]